ncbi:MAG: type II toxin-antitoxin system PemK/MazF family toxin [Cyanobacteriota bacterium]|nr:type II toxin-antitoxin system PemK/MazF family toxin [Cyanobacteriota bacterium]
MVKLNGVVPRRGDIIALELNPRTGSEQSGYRPALVISPENYNRLSRLTSREKGWPFEVKLPPNLNTQGVILADQVRSVDCQARQAKIVEAVPPDILTEVLARLETLISF